ncbi:hypothetical protein [Serratia marcescens]|uniref:hypothetical protein n=1 Tax=Serratia marcescens TaxID=615 RepID=UPI001F14AAF8|nr:hypothetical protein [Serratia marcescens]
MNAQQQKEKFLSQFTCRATQAYAAMLYDLEADMGKMVKLNNKASDRVLEIVDIYDEIPESELAKFGIKLEPLTEAA